MANVNDLVEPGHRQAFKLLKEWLGSEENALLEWQRFIENTKRPRPKVITARDLFPDEIAILYNGTKAIPDTLRNTKLKGGSGLLVSIDAIKRPCEWRFKPKIEGGIRGPWHKNVGVGNNEVRGHVYAAELGSHLDIIDDGILNIIPMSAKFNGDHFRYFERYAKKYLLGTEIIIKQPNNR